MLEVKINVIKCKNIGKVPSYPYFVLRPVKDLLGMGPAVDMLIRSLDPGRLSAFAQFDTFRSSWSDLSTFWKDSINLLLEGASLGGYHRRKTVLSKCSTQNIWFESFVREKQLRVISKSSPNKAIA